MSLLSYITGSSWFKWWCPPIFIRWCWQSVLEPGFHCRWTFSAGRDIRYLLNVCYRSVFQPSVLFLIRVSVLACYSYRNVMYSSSAAADSINFFISSIVYKYTMFSLPWNLGFINTWRLSMACNKIKALFLQIVAFSYKTQP